MNPGGICGALFTESSKAFDCLVHDYLIAKLEAYGFIYESLKEKFFWEVLLLLNDDNVASYTDDTTPYAMKEHFTSIKENWW